MKRRQFLTITAVLFALLVNAQEIKISEKAKNKFNVTKISKNNLIFENAIKSITFEKVATPEAYYVRPNIEGYFADNTPGYPVLPVLRKLVEIPLGAEAEIVIKSYKEKEFYLPDYGIVFPIVPAQAPVSKSQNEAVFEKNTTVYVKNVFIEKPVVSFDTLGIMRSSRIGRLNISPVSYNPVAQKIKVIYELDFEIVFQSADLSATEELKNRTFSPYFQSAYNEIINFSPPQLKSNLTQYPVTYVIVSDPMFEGTLQPFITWKTEKGFKVIEAYTNQPNVGNTTTSIKAYLQNLYNAATPADPAFSFVLFVGDVAQIPSFSGTTASHVSDLYYVEFTGDYFPEAYYGRFSANNVNELQPQIDKTLLYEKYMMSVPSYLGKALLVAGDDSYYAAVHGNGHINYGTNLYFNSTNNITPLVYLYPASVSSATQIKQDFNNGAGFVNYTAHCSSSGWAGPYFTTSDVPLLTNTGKYPVMIGNCCNSAEFDLANSFAEAMLRAPEKGAVGYIGGSNSTYWDEDYWWGVGFKNVVLNPSYSAASLGALDRLFHTHGEPFNEWFTTQAQIMVAGNLAVTQAASSLTHYYWEVYHLMGDPSLMPYMYEPPVLSISYQSTQVIGTSSITINTEPYTYVGISKDGVLHGAGLADASGILVLSVQPFATPGMAKIVATKQNRQPHIANINIIVPNGPYVIYNNHIIDDASGNNNQLADYGENIALDVTLENVGNHNAYAVSAQLFTTDAYVNIIDSIQAFGQVDAGQTATQNGSFSFNVAAFVPDGHKVFFDIIVKDVNDSVWGSVFPITLNAPKFVVTSSQIDDTQGNANGLLDIGETVDFKVNVNNTGGAQANNAVASLVSLDNDIMVNVSQDNIGVFNAGQTHTSVFSITASSTAAMGTPVPLVYTISDGPYTKVDTFIVVVGEIPVFNMKDSVINTCMLYFYDSGGPNANYMDNENYTVTFFPTGSNRYIKVTFSHFDVEENNYSGGCWDELFVYNGAGTNAPLIGVYCGNNIPGPFEANNAQGALTFKFTSDFSVSQSGWEALVECVTLSNIANYEKGVTYKIYPNPSHGLFNIEQYSTTSKIKTLKVFNLQGQMLFYESFSDKDMSEVIDLRHLAKGLYLMQINLDEEIKTEKIIIH